jgi:hypothetical protein
MPKNGTGWTYQAQKFSKMLAVSEAKVGKTCFLVAQALGVWPGQAHGGVVTKPEHLHVLTFDSDALTGVKEFLLMTCGAPLEAMNFKTYNFEDEARQVRTRADGGQDVFWPSVLRIVKEIQDGVRAGEVHVIIFSSLTVLYEAVAREAYGEPEKAGNNTQLDWMKAGNVLAEIRNVAQTDKAHVIWESHIYRPPPAVMKDAPPPKEQLQFAGKAGNNFVLNVSHVVRLRRNIGQKVGDDRKSPVKVNAVRPKLKKGEILTDEVLRTSSRETLDTDADTVYMDTRVTMDGLGTGRSFNERLAPREEDMTAMFMKLGLTVGGWKPAVEEKK